LLEFKGFFEFHLGIKFIYSKKMFLADIKALAQWVFEKMNL